MNDNKLIAEFMGYHTSNSQFKDENGFWNDTNVFETSWDCLMPVVEKIDDLFGDCDQVDDVINRVHNAVLSFDIDNTYHAVVEFIKTYNNER